MDTGTHSVKYEIRKGENAPCELWSIAYRRGRTYENFVCEGTHTKCQNVKDAIQ
jgi:hypothetical protein